MFIRNLFIISSFISILHAKHATEKKAPDSYVLFRAPIESMTLAMRYLPEDPIIVEAGAYNGRESCYLAKLWPKGHVHTFEPVEQLYNITAARVQSIPNITAYKLGLGDACGLRTIYLSTEEGEQWVDRVSMSSSFYEPKEHLNYSATLFKGTEEVEMITLDQWAALQGIPKVDLLWLDMQGYELPALKAGTNLLKTVSVILTEVEFIEAYEGQPLYKEVKSWLESQGFVLIAGNFKFPRTDQFFGDALFVRQELLKEENRN
ncbi:MAG TPA: FkbM family methyltransferase [Chlamydiales bacterium]|nr:FkbM family methyltransferase [Chlamydiales bacterium]